MTYIHQGYQGSVSELAVGAKYPGAVLTDAGGLMLPRTMKRQWWTENRSPVVLAFNTDYGVADPAGAPVTDSGELGYINDQVGGTSQWVALTGVAPRWYETCSNFEPPPYAHGYKYSGALFTGGPEEVNADATVLPYMQGRVGRSFVCHVYPNALGGVQTLFGWRTATGTGGYSFNDSRLMIRDGGVSLSTPLNAATSAKASLAVFSHAPGTGASSIYCDGQRYQLVADMMPGAGAAITGVTLGMGRSLLGAYIDRTNMWLRSCGLILDVTTTSDYEALCRSILGQPYVNLVTDGNALTAAGWPSVTATAFGFDKGMGTLTNPAAIGATTPQLYALMDANVIPAKRNACRNILVFWEVSNDIFVNHHCATLEDMRQSARVVADNVWRYTRKAAQAGFEVIVVTAVPRADFVNHQEGCRALVSQYMREEYRNNGAIACLSPDLLPCFTNPNNPAFYMPGSTMTATGYAVFAAMATAAISERVETAAP